MFKNYQVGGSSIPESTMLQRQTSGGSVEYMESNNTSKIENE